MDNLDNPKAFDSFVRPRDDRARKESISLPESYWAWIDQRVRDNGSDRSKVIRALVDFVRAHEGERALAK